MHFLFKTDTSLMIMLIITHVFPTVIFHPHPTQQVEA